MSIRGGQGVLAATLRGLERALAQKQRALAEVSALLALAQKRTGLAVGGRGRVHTGPVRDAVLTLINDACASGATLESACRVLGLSSRTVQRWRRLDRLDDGRLGRRRAPPNRLSDEERARVRSILMADENHGLSPRQIVPRLADRGSFVASESTMYRLLRGARARTPPACARAPRRPGYAPRVVRGPNEVWSWDISYIRGPARGVFLFLYLVVDVFSRRIMGWHVDAEESTRRAAWFIRKTCDESGVDPRGLVLHSDNGGPMRGAAMLATLQQLGIVPSLSRPRVSDDNAFAEALFRTLKRRVTYPRGRFSSIDAARVWVADFVDWYNREHLHSGISYVTPDDRHFGRDAEVLTRRRRVYEQALRVRPERWSRAPRRWAQMGPVVVQALRPQPGLTARALRCEDIVSDDNLLDIDRGPARPPS